MYSIRSLDVLSCAKITGVIYGCLALIVVPPLVLWSAFSSLLHGSQGLSSPSSWGLGLVLPAVLAPFLYGLIGFFVGALSAWVYNFAARKIGGIRLELRPVIASLQM
ncbi:MAG: hypothetical protein WBV31_17850 [Terriglobales bacterium]|jgi:hypothetical protein